MPLDHSPDRSAPPAPEALYSLDTRGELQPALSLEWLLTNGLGGFASSTVVGCNARRYHGLLVAAQTPPVGRVMALNRVGEILILDGKADQPHELSVNQFRNTHHPRGDRYLGRFDLGDTARWEYGVEGVRVTKEVQLLWHRNIVGVRYTIEPDTGPDARSDAGADGGPARPRSVELRLLPFVSLRDFHSLRIASGTQFQVAAAGRNVSVLAGNLTAYVQSDAGQFTLRPDWWYGHTYAVETERGQDDTEDLFTPGYFSLYAGEKAGITLWAALEPPGLCDWDEELKARAYARRPKAAGGKAPSRALQRLAHAAADFVVRRRQPDGTDGLTVLAGYPWFSDWGRDTMISVPGLFFSTGRFEDAARVLGVFAHYVSEGMIPNVFDDYSNDPHYNTVDASLWFVHAAYEFLRLSGDKATFENELRPACEQIIQGYQRGTRFRIGADPGDGLISAGDASTQLTWMDAKCGGIAFTPRQGKAVEINALWYNALKLTGREELAAQVAASFVQKFWLNPFRGLYDVVDDSAGPGGPVRKDSSLRPNQIFAASLPHSPLKAEQRHAVVDVVQRELLTPHGLRSLAKSDPNYKGYYSGPQMGRDAAYHNGTVWGWLIGPFLEAYLRVHDRTPQAVAQARLWLTPLLEHMERQGCVGQISEIFDGDPPHRPVGCFAQAWSVAEVLRLAVELGV